MEEFLTRQKVKDNQQVKILFKKRESLEGTFIRGNDYAELKKKNFWRIVTAGRHEEWMRTKNNDNVRIFNGDEFLRLALK
ncbi:MAG: short-chain dehydrogenase [Chitinophagaceae bacterium]|nr:short-chain dehydrogenase [Chitinophagaceae bacterium]